MFGRRVVIFVGLISVAISSSVGLQVLLPDPNRQYHYIIKTNVSSGSLTPSESASSWTLEGKLVVQVYNNFTRIRFGLEDLKTSAYSRNKGYSTYQSNDAALYLHQPWEAEFEDGFVRFLYVYAEPVWATNIKRALTFNFQLRKESGSYSREEPSLYPGTMMTYIVKDNTVKKYSSFSPSLGPVSTWSSVPEAWSHGYESRVAPDAVVTAERVYELDHRKGLISLELRGDFQHKVYDHILYVITELSLFYDIDVPPARLDKLNLTQTSFSYQNHDFSNPSNGIRSQTQQELKNRTYDILMKIAKKGIDTDNIVKNATLIHSMDFIDLLNTMSQLNYTSLNKLFEDMVLGTSYDVETSRNIFLEILPHVRTNACAILIKYLVLEQKEKIEDATILSLIRKLPFNVANHSQALLEELEVFTKLGPDFSRDIRHAGILSFATLVHKTLEAWSMKQDYFDTIVVKYFRMYSECPQYLDRMVWLQGLCNMGYSAESYTSTIYSDSSRARHERLWAALAVSTMRLNSVLESTLPILTDDKEHIQLRIASLHVFLRSNMRASDFFYVHNYIQGCGNNQLKRFWYTTIKSLEKTVYNGYRIASYYVPFVARQVSNPDSTYWATNNYIISTQDDKEAAALQVFSVGESISAVPVFAAIQLSTGGKRPHQVAIYIIAEGVTANMFKKFHTLNTRDVNVDNLVELLKKMKVQMVEKEKVHIDLVIKIQDKTVFATHINETRFETWNGEDLTRSIEDFLRFGSHINQQIVYYPLQVVVNLPTELGTPVRLQSTAVSFTSIRGNLTAPSTQDLTWKNDLHIRYQGTSVTSISTDGPLLQSEHTARVQQSIVAHLPLSFDVTVSPVTRTFALTWQNPGEQHGGIAMHSRTQIFTDSAKGKDAYTVTTGVKTDRQADDSVFFDCEHPMSGTELVEKLLAPKTNTFNLVASLQPALVLLKAFLLMSAPHLGSCGLVLPPRRRVSGKLQLSVRVDELTRDMRDKGKLTIEHSLSFKENDTSEDLYFNISGHTKFEGDGGRSKFEVLLVGNHPHIREPSRGVWKFCLQEEDNTHSSPDQDITFNPSSYEGRLSLTFGRGDVSPTCPAKGSELLVNYKGIPTHVYGELERYFEVKMMGKEIPKLELLSSTGLDKTAIGQLLGALDTKNLNLSAVVKERNGVATVSVNRGANIQVKSDNFAWLLDSWSNMQLLKKFGFYRECRLQESTVQTLAGNTEQLIGLPCNESLVLADCTSTPRFAVLRSEHGRIKVYAGGNLVKIQEGGRGVRVNVDGQECVDECVYPEDEPVYYLRVSRVGDGVKVVCRYSGIQVYYRYGETVILIPHAYMTSACGVCAGQHYQLC